MLSDFNFSQRELINIQEDGLSDRSKWPILTNMSNNISTKYEFIKKVFKKYSEEATSWVE